VTNFTNVTGVRTESSVYSPVVLVCIYDVNGTWMHVWMKEIRPHFDSVIKVVQFAGSDSRQLGRLLRLFRACCCSITLHNYLNSWQLLSYFLSCFSDNALQYTKYCSLYTCYGTAVFSQSPTMKMHEAMQSVEIEVV